MWEQNVAVLIGLDAVMSFWIKGGELRPQSLVETHSKPSVSVEKWEKPQSETGHKCGVALKTC